MIDWNKAFPLGISISRTHLKEIGLTDNEVSLFTDDEMRWMAEMIAQNYLDGMYCEDLHHLASVVLDEKGFSSPRNTSSE